MFAICVGHSRPGDSGAVSVGGVSEHTHNDRLALAIQQRLGAAGICASVIGRYEGGSYSAAMTWLAKHLRAIHAQGAIELHFNAATSTAAGHEYLYWNSSTKGRALARSLATAHQSAVPHSAPRRDRGIMPISSGDRGGQFLQKTHCPAVIAEPFFGSNPIEWQHALSNFQRYADFIAEGIIRWTQPTT